MFLERERELDLIGGALAEAGDGRGRIVLVEAPAGLGKTSLLEAAGGLAAEAGFVPLRARASELERDFAYGCVRQLLEPAVAKASEPERDLLFQGAASFSAPLFGPAASPAELSASDSSYAMLHGLYWLLNNLVADGPPAAFLLDDLQWSDAESLRLLTYLAPRLDGLRLAVLGAARTGDGAAADLERLAAAPESTMLRLDPLSVEATAALCEDRLGRPAATEFAAACQEATQGNPFFLEALLREAADLGIAPDADQADRVKGIGPSAVSRAVLLRLSGAPPEAAALVRAVAVLGDGASIPEAAQLAEIPEAAVAEAADVLVSLAVLRPGARLEFAHAIVREAVYADIGAHERAALHARAADVLAASGAQEERVAAQLTEAAPGGDPGRVELLRRVGADALARGAPAAAAAWFGRAALEQAPPQVHGEVLLELGSAELRLGRRDAVDHLSEAVELLARPVQRATAVRQLGHALTQSGRAGDAVEAVVSAIEALAPQDREQALLLEGELGYHAQHAGLESRSLAAERLERLAEIEGATPGERLVLAGLACERSRRSSSAREAHAHLETALASWRELGDPQISIAGLVYDLVAGFLAVEAVDDAESCLEHVLGSARARSSVPEQAYATCWRGWAAMRRGAVQQAEADARTALELLTTHRLLGRRFALGLLIQALVEAGELDAAESELADSGLGDEIPPSRASNYLLGGRALLHLARGRMHEGLDDLLEFGRLDELYGAANPRGSRWRSYAGLALAGLGETERARGLVADDLQRARSWGAASGIGVALRAHALVEEASVDGLLAAVDALRHAPAELERARALVDLGAALRRANRRAEARGVLQEGLELAERCGAVPLAERSRVELRAAGGRSSDPSATGVASLTVSERRVAELAATGQSNPEIAQALFVTRKTVETHLGHVYRKLEIPGRAELARALTPD